MKIKTLLSITVALILGTFIVIGAEKVTKPTNPTVPSQTETNTKKQPPKNPEKKPEIKPRPKPEPEKKKERLNKNQSSTPRKENEPDYFIENNLKFELDRKNYTASVNKADKYITTADIPSTFTVDGKSFKVNSIVEWAFHGCESLTSVIIPNTVAFIRADAFYGCKSLTSVTIPGSVTSIGDRAFEYCTSLTNIEIPNSVTSIGPRVFGECESLTSVTLPGSITSIGLATFFDCAGLTSVTIPGSVTSIGDGAFRDCKSLTSVKCHATNPPVLGRSVFFNVPFKSSTLYVPRGTKTAYQNAEGWKDFGTIIDNL